MKDDEVRKQFIKIKGIGPWTIDMFLMFTLNRPDILPVNDLGIQKGFKLFFRLNELPDEKFMVEKVTLSVPKLLRQCTSCGPYKMKSPGYMSYLIPFISALTLPLTR